MTELSLLGKTKKRLLLRLVLIESLDGVLIINNLIEYQDKVGVACLYTLLIQFIQIAIHVFKWSLFQSRKINVNLRVSSSLPSTVSAIFLVSFIQ
jgi:hypothetical protein